MLKIGITGGIGSGKSTICKIFELLGSPVFYADEEAKKLTKIHPEIKVEISKAFGSEIYDAEGILNSKLLASIVFNDPEKLEKLNSIIHPEVKKQFDKWTEEQGDKKYVLREAAIMFESGAHKYNDLNVIVTAPEMMRIERVMKRDNIEEGVVRARMKNQWAEEEKIKLSDFVISNNEEQLVIPQVIDLHEKFISLANS